MENILKNTTMLAHIICEHYLSADMDSVAVDATCGNGHDTLWLAQRCSKVYGFDIPVPAIGEEFNVAILGEKGKWYDHKVSVSNPELGQ